MKDEVSRIVEVSGVVFPDDLSFFGPHYLQYWVREVLETGGEVYVSRASGGAVSGLFTYDDAENTGTIFTRSREVFDYFCGLKPSGLLFAEMKTEHECEVYDIYTVDLNRPINHRFRFGVSVAEKRDTDKIERFMASTHPGINKRWVSVALKNGDRCLIVRLNNEIAGLGWLSMVNHAGRIHSLYVKPQFRRLGMGEDLLFARLLWLKSKRARSAFSEISHDNTAASKIALKGQMGVSGQIFLY